MKKININVNDYTFEFICNSRDTKNGFAHDCNLFINDFNITEAHCYYINRTWESWTFQSVCIEALQNAINAFCEIQKEGFFECHGYKRMTQKRKNEFNDYLKKLKYYNALMQCKDNLMYKLH